MKRRSGVSAIILTMNSQHIILDLIKSLKSLVDETIVGVDSKTIDKTYRIAEKFASKVVLLDSKGFVESMIEDVWQYTSYEWVIRLDDDEFLSKRFRNFRKFILPSVSEDIIAFPRKWVNVINNKLVYLNVKPLYPDLQYRMVRGDKASFDKKIHTPGIKINGEVRVVNNVWIYHLNWLFKSYRERLKKVVYYERFGRDLGHRSYYLWEDYYSDEYNWVEIGKKNLTTPSFNIIKKFID